MGLTGRPRVTLGIATYNRHLYLAEAIRSALSQDFTDLEVLVVLDGTTNPATEEVLTEFDGEPRLRVVRHDGNRGIAAAYNTFVSDGRGELIAMLGDDDLCLPGRLRRQVEMFDRHPDTGVVHGDAIVIDAAGRQTGVWNTAEFPPNALLQSFLRSHNHLVDPSRMVHRRVYEAIGGYDPSYPLANDFDFWLRAAREFRFRHCAGGPLVAVRRHSENTSHEQAARAHEIADVERALEAALERHPLRELVPELDWAVLDPRRAERQALLRLAAALDARLLPLPGLAVKLRERAAAVKVLAPRPAPSRAGRRLLMTSFGFNDTGGGTTVPRLAAKELVRRGWEVTVFHAATASTSSGLPYEISEREEDGVRLVGVHNRPHGLFDLGHPLRELDDPPIAEAFAQTLDAVRPDAVHFHNLHNLGASLMDHAASRGVPAYFTTHNYWLICPRAYLLDGHGRMCGGPGDGSACATCVGSHDITGHQARLAEIRTRAERSLTAILAVSEAVRRTLLAAGYPADLIDTVRQAMPQEQDIWASVGGGRRPGRVAENLTVAFLGSAYPHKGPQLLVEAAQRTQAELNIRILGEVPARFGDHLRSLDHRGVVEFAGAFSPSEIGGLLAGVDAVALPSAWWDCAPLAAAECLAARTPLIVPRLGGLPESIRDGIDGLSFAGLDVDDLAGVLDRLAGEAGLLERLQAGIQAPRAFAAYIDELEAYYAGARPGRNEPPPGAPAPTVRWQGDHGQPTSLAIINDRVSERVPFEVQRVTRAGEPLDPPLAHAADVEVRHQWPPDLRPAPSGRLAVIAPWEFGAIPRDWLDPLHRNVDEIWVPSEYVRRMYLDAGLDPQRVVTIPNGVDLDVFCPQGPERDLPTAGDGTRFLFVGGLIARKGADLLFDAWREAFAGREDVTLVIKDFGAGGIYRDGYRAAIRAHVDAGALPRIVLIDDEQLPPPDLAALYRACDVLVQPYRGEGFAMPVLEAMACGLPVITTAGGPTDEFVPDDAGWRIRSRRGEFADDRVETIPTHGRPWVLEPDLPHLAALMRAADAASDEELGARGAAGRAAAQDLSWDHVAALYQERAVVLVGRRPIRARAAGHEPFPLTEEVAVRVLATPAWHGDDGLPALLAEWTQVTTPATPACLYLLADPGVDGAPGDLEARVLAAAATGGADLDACADINVVMEPVRADRDVRLHAAVDAYVPLHAGCAGHERLAREASSAVLTLGDGSLAELLAAALGAAVA